MHLSSPVELSTASAKNNNVSRLVESGHYAERKMDNLAFNLGMAFSSFLKFVLNNFYYCWLF